MDKENSQTLNGSRLSTHTSSSNKGSSNKGAQMKKTPYIPVITNSDVKAVSDVLRKRGVRCNASWLEQCIGYLKTQGVLPRSPSMVAEKVFQIFLHTDIYDCAEDSMNSMNMNESKEKEDGIPAKICGMHREMISLNQPTVLQINEVVNVGQTLHHKDGLDNAAAAAAGGAAATALAARREAEEQSGHTAHPTGNRFLKLFLTDGINAYHALEATIIPGLSENLAAGGKISLQNVMIRRGVLMLRPSCAKFLGGEVEKWTIKQSIYKKLGQTGKDAEVDEGDSHADGGHGGKVKNEGGVASPKAGTANSMQNTAELAAATAALSPKFTRQYNDREAERAKRPQLKERDSHDSRERGRDERNRRPEPVEIEAGRKQAVDGSSVKSHVRPTDTGMGDVMEKRQRTGGTAAGAIDITSDSPAIGTNTGGFSPPNHHQQHQQHQQSKPDTATEEDLLLIQAMEDAERAASPIPEKTKQKQAMEEDLLLIQAMEDAERATAAYVASPIKSDQGPELIQAMEDAKRAASALNAAVNMKLAASPTKPKPTEPDAFDDLLPTPPSSPGQSKEKEQKEQKKEKGNGQGMDRTRVATPVTAVPLTLTKENATSGTSSSSNISSISSTRAAGAGSGSAGILLARTGTGFGTKRALPVDSSSHSPPPGRPSPAKKSQSPYKSPYKSRGSCPASLLPDLVRLYSRGSGSQKSQESQESVISSTSNASGSGSGGPVDSKSMPTSYANVVCIGCRRFKVNTRKVKDTRSGLVKSVAVYDVILCLSDAVATNKNTNNIASDSIGVPPTHWEVAASEELVAAHLGMSASECKARLDGVAGLSSTSGSGPVDNVDRSRDEAWKKAEKIRIAMLFESLAGTVAVVPTAMLQQIEKGGAAKAKKKAKEGKDGKDKEAPVLTAVAVTVP